MIKRGLNQHFLEVGKIKIGGKGELRKSKSGNDYRLPVQYNHFVITTTERGKDGNYIINKEIMDQLGSEPKEISIRLPFDTIDTNFYTSFSYYASKKCICRGDGEKASRTGKDEKTIEVECNPETCEFLKDGRCKVSGILSCFLPQDRDLGGIYRFRTHSWNTVSGILSSLQYFSEQTGGILQNMPLKLKLVKKTTEEHGTVNVVTVILDGVRLNKMRELAITEREQRLALSIDTKRIEQQAIDAGFLDDTKESKDIQEEYYPETTEPPAPDKGISPDDIKEKLAEKREPPSRDGDAEEKELF